MRTDTAYNGDKRIVLNEDHVARVTTEIATVTVFRASVEVWTPAPEGASYINHLSCNHGHTTPEAAVTCGTTLGRRELRKYA